MAGVLIAGTIIGVEFLPSCLAPAHAEDLAEAAPPQSAARSTAENTGFRLGLDQVVLLPVQPEPAVETARPLQLPAMGIAREETPAAQGEAPAAPQIGGFKLGLIRKPDYATWLLTGGIVAGWAALAADGDTDQIEGIGDVLRIGLPATGFGFALGTKDWDGMVQLLISVGATQVATEGMKELAQKVRPNNSSFGSFPSGHASSAFSGAAFIHTRYGPRFGIPAYMLAAYTAYSRVEAEKHHLDDVLGGMSLALITNWLVVNPIDDRFAITPVLGEDEIGAQVSLSDLRIADKHWSGVLTHRENRIRIISVRRSRDEEILLYES
jgi:hypothetical protein